MSCNFLHLLLQRFSKGLSFHHLLVSLKAVCNVQHACGHGRTLPVIDLASTTFSTLKHGCSVWIRFSLRKKLRASPANSMKNIQILTS